MDDSLFTGAGGFDYSFVERIEVVKGPNGILYGTHMPGGVVNIVSKRPRAKSFTKFSAMGGSWGFWRGEIDTSQFIDKNKRFSYRISGAVSNTRGPIDWPGDPKLGFRGINSSVLYRSRTGLEVWFYSAFIRDSSSRAKHVVPRLRHERTRAAPASPVPPVRRSSTRHVLSRRRRPKSHSRL